MLTDEFSALPIFSLLSFIFILVYFYNFTLILSLYFSRIVFIYFSYLCNPNTSYFYPSSETRVQIVGARESLNGWKNMARRKVKNGEKSPWGHCLTRPLLNGHRRSGFWLVPENFCVFLPNQKPERQRPFGTGLVRHCPQGLFSPFFTFLRAIFSRSFRLSLAPTICPWVSENDFYLLIFFLLLFCFLDFSFSLFLFFESELSCSLLSALSLAHR